MITDHLVQNSRMCDEVRRISYRNESVKKNHINRAEALATRVELMLYTGFPRRKGPNFGRVFLRSNYTDITQNTYIQSSMVTEILAREKSGHLGVCLL